MQSWCKRTQPKKNSLWYHMKHPTVNSHQVRSNFVSIYNKTQQAEHWHSQQQVFFRIKQYFKDLKQYQRNHSNSWSKYYNSYFWALSNDILWKFVCFLCTQLVCNVRPFQTICSETISCRYLTSETWTWISQHTALIVW